MIQKCVATRSTTQVRSHAQKYDLKLTKTGNSELIVPRIPRKQLKSFENKSTIKEKSMSFYEPIEDHIIEEAKSEIQSSSIENTKKAVAYDILLLEKIDDLEKCAKEISTEINSRKDLRDISRSFLELKIIGIQYSKAVSECALQKPCEEFGKKLSRIYEIV